MKRLSLVAGALVVHEGRTYRIVEAIDMSKIGRASCRERV